MELKVWEPILSLEHEMQSMFDRVFGRRGETFLLRPDVDVFREEGRIVVKVEMPGIDPEKDVEVTFHDGMLILKGEKTREKEVEEDRYYLLERGYGMFERRIPLPEDVDPEVITASYERGVLTVTVPTRGVETAPPVKRIPVTVK